MEFKKELVTPEIAKIYLLANTRNRNAKDSRVKMYANDMKNGKWKDDTAETIKISKTGQVLDGQHRLLAVIESNTAINFWVATGLDDSVFDVIDTGSTRSAADVFKIDQIKNAKNIAAIISFYYALKTGHTNLKKHQSMTNSELLNVYNSNPEHWQKIHRVAYQHYLDFSKILPLSFVGGFLAYLEHCVDGNGYRFIKELCTGASITNSSILLLRQKLITDKLSIKRMPRNHKIAIITKTWNYYNTNKEVRIIKYSPKNDKKPEAFRIK